MTKQHRIACRLRTAAEGHAVIRCHPSSRLEHPHLLHYKSPTALFSICIASPVESVSGYRLNFVNLILFTLLPVHLTLTQSLFSLSPSIPPPSLPLQALNPSVYTLQISTVMAFQDCLLRNWTRTELTAFWLFVLSFSLYFCFLVTCGINTFIFLAHVKHTVWYMYIGSMACGSWVKVH